MWYLSASYLANYLWNTRCHTYQRTDICPCTITGRTSHFLGLSQSKWLRHRGRRVQQWIWLCRLFHQGALRDCHYQVEKVNEQPFCGERRLFWSAKRLAVVFSIRQSLFATKVRRVTVSSCNWAVSSSHSPIAKVEWSYGERGHARVLIPAFHWIW